MKKTAVLFLAIAAAFGCESPSQASEKLPVEITGKLNLVSSGMVYFEKVNERNAVTKLDSVEISKGTFSFKTNIDEPGIYQINVINDQVIGLILDGGEKLTITADGMVPEQGAPKAEIKGSPNMEEFLKVSAQMQTFSKQSNELQTAFNNARTEKAKAEIREKYLASMAANREIILPSIQKMGTSLAGILAANNFLNPETDLDYLKSLAEKVQEEGKTHYFAKLFVQQMNSQSATEIGALAPNFSLKDLNGNTVKLTELRGKTVIIDFWATWCGPCIMSFPGMKKAVDKYKDNPDVKFLFVDTFERVSEDKLKDHVQKFITSRGLEYLNPVLDAGNKTALSYGVEGIPAKFCIDKEGKIKYKSTGYLGSAEAVYEEMVNWVEGK